MKNFYTVPVSNLSTIFSLIVTRTGTSILMLFLLLATVNAKAQTCPAGNIVYVNASASGSTHDGTTWAKAYLTLQDALYITKNCTVSKQIWVAKGTYYPDEGGGKTNNDKNASFQLQNKLAIYGGFAGTETSLANRNWKTNVTRLSGDIDKNNMPDAGNAIIIVTASNTDTSAKLNGFTITGGYTDIFDAGAGMYNESASPTITNCIFSGNTSSSSAGAMFNDVSSPVITNCVFAGNIAANDGGAMWNSSGSNPVITNCTFTGNTANTAGAIYNDQSYPVITNCVIWNNEDYFGAPSILDDSHSSSFITYSLIQGITTTDSSNNLDGITNASNTNYPLFIKPLDPATAPSTSGDFHLLCGSPVINKGNNIAGMPATDADDNPRIVNTTIDLGAYENQGGCGQSTTTTVATSGNSSCQGSLVKFTATVLINGNIGTPASKGGVTFTQGATVLADSIVIDTTGHASFSTDTLGSGAHNIVATYKPVQGFAASNNFVIQNVNARPTGVISGNATYCSGNNTVTNLTINVTGNGTISGILSNGTSFNGTAPIITVQVIPTSTTTYIITSLNDANCTAQASGLTGNATVTINPKPTVSTISYTGSTSVCSGSTALLRDTTSGGFWSTSGNTASISSSGTVTFATVSTSTTVTIYYTVSSNGCTSQASIVFTVNPPVTVKPITGNTNICGTNSTTQLSDATSGGTWGSSNTAIVTVSTTGTVTAKAVGSATINYTVSSGGCTSVAQAAVTVNAPPKVAAITGSSYVMKGSSIQLSDTTKGGTWNSKNTAVATVSSAGLVKGIAAGTDTIYYTITSSPCSAAASKVIKVYNSLTATVTVGTIACYGSTTKVIVNASGGVPPYRYQVGNSALQNKDTFDVVAGNYGVAVLDQIGNEYDTKIIVTQPTVLKLQLKSETNASSTTAADGSFTVTGSGGTPGYVYSKDSGTSYQSSASFTRLKAGTYKVSIKDAHVCMALNILTVTVGVGGKLSPIIAKRLAEDDGKITASVYPNPSLNSFNLQLKNSNSNEKVEIKVTDILGHTVYYTTGSATGYYKFGEYFTSGVYVVEVIYKTGIKTFKIVKH